jgi:hypothetical protein
MYCFQTWDDHETANNAFGDGQAGSSGAENHQPSCPVNASSPVSEKNSAQCDRDEGDIVDRLKAATQAYLEWMPLRAGAGTMGVVDLASITQVIEWGSMATIVAFDTRITHRSKGPTLASSSKSIIVLVLEFIYFEIMVSSLYSLVSTMNRLDSLLPLCHRKYRCVPVHEPVECCI